MCHWASSPFIKRKKKKRKKGNGGPAQGPPKKAAAEGGFLPFPARPGSSSPDCAASGRRANGKRTINSPGHKLLQEVLAAHQLLNKIDCLPPPQTQRGYPLPPLPGRGIPPRSGNAMGAAAGPSGRGVTHILSWGRTGPAPRWRGGRPPFRPEGPGLGRKPPAPPASWTVTKAPSAPRLVPRGRAADPPGPHPWCRR